MIRFKENLYLTKKTVKKSDKIIKDIENGKFISLVCLVTLSANTDDVFDIIPLFNLKIRSDIYDDIVVIGIAENNKAAIKMCAKLVEHYYMSDMSKNMREYFTDLD